MARQRGILQAIRELRGALPKEFTIDDAERLLKKRGWKVSRDQVRQTLARMSNEHEYQELERAGHQRNRTYSFTGSARDAALVSPEDPIEVLLDAFAQAEPILRRMLEARRIMLEEGGA